MDALNAFMKYMKYLSFLSSPLGLNVFASEYRTGIRTYISYLVLIVYVILTVNSIIIATEGTDILKALSFGGFFFQCALKIYFTLSRSELYYQNHEQLKKYIYLRHLNGDEKQKAVVLKNITLLLNLVKVTTVLYLSTILLFSAYPVYMYVFEKTVITMFPLYIPGVSTESILGYWMTNSFHILFAIYGLFGALASDTAFMMFIFHIVSYTELFAIEFDKFAEDLTLIQNDADSKNHSDFCHTQMRQIISSHQEILAYLKSLQVCYENICKTQVGTTVMTLSFNLFLALVTDWYATYGFATASLFQMFIYSVLGTIMQLMNERVMGMIYDFPWHLLTNSERRSFTFLLRRSQLFIEMHIRGFGPLNMEAFTEIMRLIYSSFTMLYSFLTEQEL
ncbi:putative odorant receptor 83c [Sabethes cyaneus]|uniref:putative odorant receptor 83c n=1 Tax=Sabethes cyaneus TaxID=53552 RepID=UPI00237DA5ED|nr:putative odorant receptor 83c [Sabethes cyaneus]